MTSQRQPDLAVGASVSDNNPAVGATFTLSVTVQNDGDGASAATTLRYYRSMDATITISDTEVGTVRWRSLPHPGPAASRSTRPAGSCCCHRLQLQRLRRSSDDWQAMHSNA